MEKMKTLKEIREEQKGNLLEEICGSEICNYKGKEVCIIKRNEYCPYFCPQKGLQTEVRKFVNRYPWGTNITLITTDGIGMIEISKGEKENYAYISNLNVFRTERQKGIGNALFSLAEKEVRLLGLDVMMLNVAPDSWMKDWYIRKGFRELRTTEDGFVEMVRFI